MTKQKVLNIQLGSFYDSERKKSVPVVLPAYPKKIKDGSTRYEANIKIFVNEMEIKEKKPEESSEDDGL